MTKEKRITIFIITMALLAIVYLIIKSQIPPDSEIYVVIFSSLIMLSFASLFIEHFFTTPSDVLANTISILLVLAPIKESLWRLGIWYWIFFTYNLVFLLISLSALLLVDKNKSTSSFQNRLSNELKRFSTFFGHGRLLYFVLFFLTLLFYIDLQSREFIVLFSYATAILLVDPKKYALDLIKSRKTKRMDVGEIIGVQSKNTFIARLFTERLHIHRFDFVEFKYSMSEDQEIHKGLIIDKYLLDEEQWIKILSTDEIEKSLIGTCDDQIDAQNIVYKISGGKAPGFLDRFIGVVIDGSTIGKIRFEYNSETPVSEGELLEIIVRSQKVLYQVVQGLTEDELIQFRNERGFIVGEAVQLGLWNENRQAFEKFGWVPNINSPVLLASNIEPKENQEDELQLGVIPNTNYPVLINKKDAISHHLAILGITGCGKSMLTRYLIREVAEDGTKVICVDFTNEYRDKFPDHNVSSIIPTNLEQVLFNAIDTLSNELSNYPNQQNKHVINAQKKTLYDNFFDSIRDFLESDKVISLFELPDVSNTTGILEYTKWFFKILFDIARLHQNFGRQLCIVLEEAHTVIPEWTFIGVSEKKATSLVNSIGQIALQGRKYNVGFIIVAQRTANVSKTVLTQCNSIIAFQQFDNTAQDFLSNYVGREMVSALPTLRFRQAIAVGKAFRTGIPVILEVKEIREPSI